MPKLIIDDKFINKFYEKLLDDAKTPRKIFRLLEALARDPATMPGKAEKLKHRPNACSARIDKHNRLVYEHEGDYVTILDIEGHYDDN